MAGRKGRPKGRCGFAKAVIFCSATFTAAAACAGTRSQASRSIKKAPRNANGMTRDGQGRLVVCHHFSRCVDRVEADGSITVIASSYRGYKLNRPNDVVVKSDGSIYFTDPPPRPPLTPPEHTPEQDCAGVYRVSPDLTTINRIVSTFVNPNGLCFSPDEKILYINDSNAHWKLIKAYDVEGNGAVDLGSERLFCDLKGDPRSGHPDGMKCDVEGNVYCTGPGGIWVIDPKRRPHRHDPDRRSSGQAVNWGETTGRRSISPGAPTINRIRLEIPGIPVPRSAIKARGLSCFRDRALRHHLDQVGAVRGRAVNVGQQSAGRDWSAHRALRRPVGFQRGLKRGTRMTPFWAAPVAATRTSPDLVAATKTPVNAKRDAGWRNLA